MNVLKAQILPVFPVWHRGLHCLAANTQLTHKESMANNWEWEEHIGFKSCGISVCNTYSNRSKLKVVTVHEKLLFFSDVQVDTFFCIIVFWVLDYKP